MTQTSELVERLLHALSWAQPGQFVLREDHCLVSKADTKQAAAALQALEAEVARLREAIFMARDQLAKGGPYYSGPAYQCDQSLLQALGATDDR